MKKLFYFAAVAAAALLAASCQEENQEEPVPSLEGVLVLNNGNWGGNDASISLYDTDSKTVSGGMFQKANGQMLGDLGQDILKCGNELYIAVNGSQVIFVTDLELNIKKVIEASDSGSKLSPRSLAYSGGKVYVTYYEGFLGEIDTETYNIRTTPVGPNPEGLAYAKGKLYVANSGGYLPGYNNTVSVVDAASFKETSTIEVNTNPATVVASSDGSFVYVTSFGNYYDIQPKLQVIEVSSSKVSDVDYADVKSIAMGKDDTMLVVTGGYDENWNIAGTVWKHNARTNSKSGKFTEDLISPYYSISADSETGSVFVGISDYTTNGDVYFFDASGKQIDKFDSQGLNPQKCLFLTK
ncbi:MAG: YncE family protein [Bacteroidia bacterium]|nr:YncE family protein [Bacteroidia bacterium]